MLKKYICLALIALFPSIGFSANLTNFYLRGLAGYNHVSIPSTPEARLEASEGFIVGGAIGYRFSRTFRIESELSYRCNDLDRLVIRGDSADYEFEMDGEISSFAYMGNVLFDMPLSWPARPYFGFGLGGCHAWADGSLPMLNGTPDELKLKMRREGGAYQVIAGLSLLRCNRIGAGIEYHFLDSMSSSDSESNHSVTISCRGTF